MWILLWVIIHRCTQIMLTFWVITENSKKKKFKEFISWILSLGQLKPNFKLYNWVRYTENSRPTGKKTLLFYATYKLPSLNKFLCTLNKSIQKHSTECISSYTIVLIVRTLILHSVGTLHKKLKMKFMKNYNFVIYSALERDYFLFPSGQLELFQ